MKYADPMSQDPPLTPPTQSELRWFGVLVPLALAVLGAVLFWQVGLGLAAVPWSIALLIGVCFLFFPHSRRPLLRGWMRMTRPIGVGVSNAVLAAIFLLVITPCAAALRLLGRDGLALRPDRPASSYWRIRERNDDLDGYFHQS